MTCQGTTLVHLVAWLVPSPTTCPSENTGSDSTPTSITVAQHARSMYKPIRMSFFIAPDTLLSICHLLTGLMIKRILSRGSLSSYAISLRSPLPCLQTLYGKFGNSCLGMQSELKFMLKMKVRTIKSLDMLFLDKGS